MFASFPVFDRKNTVLRKGWAKFEAEETILAQENW